jgi:hypothetical protein
VAEMMHSFVGSVQKHTYTTDTFIISGKMEWGATQIIIGVYTEKERRLKDDMIKHIYCGQRFLVNEYAVKMLVPHYILSIYKLVEPAVYPKKT